MKSIKFILLFLVILIGTIVVYFSHFDTIEPISKTNLYSCAESKAPTKYNSFMMSIITDKSLSERDMAKKLNDFSGTKYYISKFDNPNAFDECENKIKIKKGEIIEINKIFPQSINKLKGYWGVVNLPKREPTERIFHYSITDNYFYIFLKDFDEINESGTILTLQKKNDTEYEKQIEEVKNKYESDLKIADRKHTIKIIKYTINSLLPVVYVIVLIIIAIMFYRYAFVLNCPNCKSWGSRKRIKSEYLGSSTFQYTSSERVNIKGNDGMTNGYADIPVTKTATHSSYRHYYNCKKCKHEWNEIS